MKDVQSNSTDPRDLDDKRAAARIAARDADATRPIGVPAPFGQNASPFLFAIDTADPEHVRCSYCGAFHDLADFDEDEETWQQWRCSECGSWEDKTPEHRDALHAYRSGKPVSGIGTKESVGDVATADPNVLTDEEEAELDAGLRQQAIDNGQEEDSPAEAAAKAAGWSPPSDDGRYPWMRSKTDAERACTVHDDDNSPCFYAETAREALQMDLLARVAVVLDPLAECMGAIEPAGPDGMRAECTMDSDLGPNTVSATAWGETTVDLRFVVDTGTAAALVRAYTHEQTDQEFLEGTIRRAKLAEANVAVLLACAIEGSLGEDIIHGTIEDFAYLDMKSMVERALREFQEADAAKARGASH